MSNRELLTPLNSVMLFIDHQPQMAFGVRSIDRQLLRSNVVARDGGRPASPVAVPRGKRIPRHLPY